MKSHGVTVGRIIVADRELGGNLHRFGDARIALAVSQNYAPAPAESAERAAAYVRHFGPD
jgi:hypothetical protein